MTKFTKKFCLTLCMCAGLLLSTLGFSTMKMPTAQAFSTSSFEMVGAALRVSGTNNGLRFIAEIGTDLYAEVDQTEDAYFGMIIIPDEYRTTYADEITAANGDYVTALKGTGAPLLNIENIIPYEYDSDDDGETDRYRINGVISNVKYYNLNYDFVGIAYHYDPSQGYVYVDDVENVPVRNVYYVAMAALYDPEKEYSSNAIDALDEYKFLSENQLLGNEQPDESAIATYQTNMDANRTSFDGETVDFNSAANISLVSAGIHTTNRPSDIEIADDGESSYLTFNAKYAFVNVSFPKLIEVFSDTVITLKVKGITTDDGTWFKIQKYGTVDTAGNGLHSYGFNSDGEWHTVNVPADVLGYSAGDVLNGIQLQFSGNNSAAYVDYITVTSEEADRQAILEKLAQETKDTSYVATYNDEDYSALISTNQSYTISDGLLTFSSASAFGGNAVTLQFVEEKTVSAGDYIVLKMGANNRVKTYTKSNTTLSDIFTSSITTTNNQTSLYHNEGSDKTTGNDDSYTPFANRTWAVTYDTNCTLKKLILPLSYLGYSAGDVVSNIKIAAWANDGVTTKMVIDYVTYVSTADYQNGVVADFTKDGSQSLVVGDTYTMGGFWQYYGVAESGISYNQEGYVSITQSSGYQGVRFLINPTVLTADSTVSVTLRWTPNCDGSAHNSSTCTWCRPGYGGTYTDEIKKYAGYVAGEWMTVSFNLISLFSTNARCQELQEENPVMYYLNFYFHTGTLDIKTISING